MAASNGLSNKFGNLLIIGGGRMGEAILAGLLGNGGFPPEQVMVADPSPKKQLLEDRYGVRCVADASEAPNPDTAIIAVKPQVLHDVLTPLVAGGTFSPKRVISIAAGISTDTISDYFPDAYVVRAMPNTPLMVGRGMVGLSVSRSTPEEEGSLARDLFSCMGDAIVVDEELQDGVVALSGSGPAYFALFVRELARAGEELGIPADLALRLSLQTMAGTAELLERTRQTPDELIDAVSSPGGTTIAALDAMDAAGVGDAIRAGAMACAKRSRELASR